MRLHQIPLSPPSTACQYYPSWLWSFTWLHTPANHTWAHKQFTPRFMLWKHLCDELQHSPYIISDTLKQIKNTFTQHISYDSITREYPGARAVMW